MQREFYAHTGVATEQNCSPRQGLVAAPPAGDIERQRGGGAITTPDYQDADGDRPSPDMELWAL